MEISISGFNAARLKRIKKAQAERKARKSTVELTKQATSTLKITDAEVEVLRNWTQLFKGRKATDTTSSAILKVGRKVAKTYPPKPPKVLYRGLSFTAPLLAKLFEVGSLPAKGKANSWTSSKQAAIKYAANSDIGVLLKRNSEDLDVVVNFSKQVQALYSNKNQLIEQSEYLCSAASIELADVAYILLKPAAALKVYELGYLATKPSTKARSIFTLTKAGALKPSALKI